MKSIGWKDALELVGIFSILASLIFVSMQLKKEENLLQLELRNYMIESSVAVNEPIIEHAAIWIKGNAGEEMNAVESAVYGKLLINFNDWHFHTSEVFREIDPDVKDQIVSLYAGFLMENSGAYQVWIERELKLNTYRTALDPNETITSEWIDEMISAIEVLKERVAK